MGRPRTSPAISVILPTYNRASYLPRAFSSIAAQTLQDWELIVIDDGSTDDTRAVVARLSHEMGDHVSYSHQANSGPYGARSAGLALARGESVAFFDSDDEWLPHHLQKCHDALRQHSDVDWVFGASRLVDDVTGEVLAASSFEVGAAPRPFRRLRCRVSGDLHIFDEPDIIARILEGAGLFSGLQNSVIRTRVFERVQFDATSRNEAEDQLFVIRAIAAGFRLAYFTDIHHVYHVHDANSSASARGITVDRQARIYTDLIRGFERLPDSVSLTKRQQSALRGKLAREYFWHLGYATYWSAGRREAALDAYRRALALDPFRFAYWKTYVMARLCSLSTAGEPRA